MILKLRSSVPGSGVDTWTYIDGVERVDTYGFLFTEPEVNPSLAPAAQEAPRQEAFAYWEPLRAAVARTWGPDGDRSFDHEFWPPLPGEGSGQEIRPSWALTAVAYRDGKRSVLLVLMDDAFLLSDEGKTVDRLR